MWLMAKSEILKNFQFSSLKVYPIIVCFLPGNSAADKCTYPPMKMEQTECSETSAYKIQTPRNYPEESIQHTEQGEILKSRIYPISFIKFSASWRPLFNVHFPVFSFTLLVSDASY